jgi:hypothetical protein
MSVVHCRREAYDVYIGRGGPWGNPYRIGPDGSRDEVIESYRRWLWDEIEAGRVDRAELARLHGKRLGCYCAPRRCHGEVLERAAMWALVEEARDLASRAKEMTLANRESGGNP